MMGFKEHSKLPHIYCDMDEVLVGFVEGADKQLINEGYEHFFDKAWHEHEEQVRWSVIDRNPEFWAELPFLEDGQKLWEYIRKYKPSILSAVTKFSKTCETGKQKWLESNLNLNDINTINLVGRSEKKLYAINKDTGLPNVLIDDYDKNIREFKEAGGIAIHHVSLKQTLKELKKLGF